MKDLIEREAALACFHAWVDKHGDVCTPDDMPEYQAIEALPSAEPEIIRCKDCKHWYPDADTGMACEFTNMGQPENGFCNWAERRTDEAD